MKKTKENQDYRAAYEAAEDELTSLVENKAQIDLRILALRKTMNALATLISQEDSSFDDYASGRINEILELTITDDLMKIMSAASGPMTSTDVYEELKKLGGSSAIQHSNPLATINAVLDRHVQQGRLRVTVKDGRKVWSRKLPADHPLQKLRRQYQDVPNPLGRNMNEMLKEPGKKR